MTGAYVLAAAVLLAVGFGLYRRNLDGRARPVRATAGAPRLDDSLLGGPLGTGATLVQFSSAVCAPCRVTKRLLTELATADPAVAHIEIDAEQRLDLAGTLAISRTPTVLVLDADGVVRNRIVGAPRRQEVLAALALVTGPYHPDDRQVQR